MTSLGFGHIEFGPVEITKEGGHDDQGRELYVVSGRSFYALWTEEELRAVTGYKGKLP